MLVGFLVPGAVIIIYDVDMLLSLFLHILELFSRLVLALYVGSFKAIHTVHSQDSGMS